MAGCTLINAARLKKLLSREDKLVTGLNSQESNSILVLEKVTSIAARIELLAYRTKFDPAKRTGEIPINTSLFSRNEFGVALTAMKEAFKAGFCVSELVAVAFEGESLGELAVPLGKVGIATVSSIAVSGVLLKAGVPLDSRFGGLLQYRKGNPLRFIELIEYAGCSLSPAEIFVASRMTGVAGVTESGEGRILAHFWEIPSACRLVTQNVLKKLSNAGIGGVVVMGKPNETVCETPVGLNKIGIILQSGLNPVAAAAETGIKVVNFAMSGLIDYNRLRHFETYV
jgi:repressor of nif and glnA expression